MDIGQIHKDLAPSAAQLAEMFDKAPIGIALIERQSDEKFVCRYANAAFLQLWGNSGEGTTADVSGPLTGQWLDQLKLCFALPDNGQCYATKDLPDRAITCQIKVAKLTDPNLFVLTASESPDSQLGHSVAMEQREDFVATLTHDLKTPIVGANMVLSALLDGTLGKLNEQQGEIIAKLLTSNQALLKMIHHLLEIYRYESGTPLMVSEVDIVGLLKSCLDELKPQLENKQQQIEFNFSSPTIELACDPHALLRVFINLLGNAIKFTPEKGVIKAEIEDRPQEVIVKIIDSGSGIDPQDQPRLFQRFWQGEPGKRYAAGTGLGLYFCSQVVKAHQGSITCETSPGSGSTFTARLPKNLAPGNVVAWISL
jgi:signal transduction histidine kinase